MQDVLVTLLNNLKVQERQNRVCTTVAIAIVAETCSPFTVLPALMNEYKVRPFTWQSWPGGPGQQLAFHVLKRRLAQSAGATCLLFSGVAGCGGNVFS